MSDTFARATTVFRDAINPDDPYSHPYEPFKSEVRALHAVTIAWAEGWVSDIVNTPTGDEVTGARYLVGTSPSGVFVNSPNAIAVLLDDVWQFGDPSDGVGVYNRADDRLYKFDGTAWALSTATDLGLGTSANYDESHFALSARSITAGAGLSGGGALTSDITLSANVETVAGRTGDVVISTADISGLGSAATHAASDFDSAGAAAAVSSASLQKASNLSDVANAATARTNIVAAQSGANSDITRLQALTRTSPASAGTNTLQLSDPATGVVYGLNPTTLTWVALYGSLKLAPSLSALDTACASAGVALRVDTNVTLAANTTLTTEVIEFRGGIINRAGFDITIKRIIAPTIQIFDKSVSGTVSSFGTQSWYPEWFGAVPSKTSGAAVDCTVAMQAALNSAGVTGATFQAGNGYYGYTGTLGTAALSVPVNVTIRGAGKGLTIFYCLADGVGLFYNYTATSGSIAFRDFTAWGYADRTPTLRGSGARIVNCYSLDYFEASNIEAKYSQDMTITGIATECRVSKCSVLNSLRDGINVTGSQRIFVEENRIEACGDDCIAVHLSSASVGNFDESINVSNNIARKSYGIKILGARNCTVSGNSLRFYYGYGVYLSASSTEGRGAKFNVKITDNDFTDGINSSRLGAGSQNQVIGLGFTQSLGSGATTWNANVGQYDSTNTFIQKPEPYINYADGTTGTYPIPPNGQIIIANNTARQTINNSTQLPIAKFSDAGFGPLWFNTGVVDPAMAGLIGEMDFVQSTTSGFDIMGMTIANNSAEGLGNGVNLNGIASMRDVVHTDNVYRRLTGNGLTLVATSATTTVTLVSKNNTFNLDPYCENTDHPVATGIWANTATTSSGVGIVLSRIAGVVSDGDSFQNVRKDISLSVAGSFAILRPNYFYSWATDGSTQAGIGTFNIVNSGNHFWIDSNPTSGTFNSANAPSDSAFVTAASAQPSSGYYHKGQFVTNNNPALSTSKVTTGWIRLTTGNANVANTDWAAQVVPNS